MRIYNATILSILQKDILPDLKQHLFFSTCQKVPKQKLES